MLVSVLMPTTANRKDLSKLALQCFHNQNWEEKELIVLDGIDTIGSKLNRGCEQAKGSIILRWDDDDWSFPFRITDQVSRILSHKKSLTGYYQIYFWDAANNRASQYGGGARDYCLGTSMCFTKDYWKSNPFQDTSIGEDFFFQKKARADKQAISLPANQAMVARLHKLNTSSNRVRFPQVNKELLNPEFFEQLGG